MLRCYSCGRGWNAASSVCLVAKLCLTFCNPMECRPPGSSAMGFSRKEYWSGLSCPLLEDLPSPWIKLRPSASQGDSLPSEPPGKPKNTGVGSLSFLQGIFPTQELNQGLLHWRRILYQLSCQGICWVSTVYQVMDDGEGWRSQPVRICKRKKESVWYRDKVGLCEKNSRRTQWDWSRVRDRENGNMTKCMSVFVYLMLSLTKIRIHQK